MSEEVPLLRSLSPEYVADQHKVYVDILKAELVATGDKAPRNIALTGHYGSGKSSVLTKVQSELASDGVRVINLSLPSLGIGDGRIRTDGDKALDKTNLIQKEIVKQLLYRRKPSDMPASRYSRLDTFQRWPSLRVAALVGLVATGIALIAKLPNKVRESLPSDAWEWVDQHLWWNLSGPIQWASLLIVFAVVMSATHGMQKLLQQRLRVTELAAGPTKVTLSEAPSSYFDEYLDEIVYFFQTSKTAVVIFEDLDRFRDPHIFETLRELNLLLNNAEQTGTTPIRFVYAIRDSIFEQLDVESGAEPVEPPGEGTHEPTEASDPSEARGETRRLMSTNRTKFFDLVLPMVPFISHRTSRDLIRAELQVIPENQRPKPGVVDIVGAHLTDMRLIKNICNEYEVFRRRILVDDGLKELTPDRLFASIVYKNLYLADYEKIRDGESLLDDLYRAYRDWVAQQTTTARRAERAGRLRARRVDGVGKRANRLGSRLQAVLTARPLPNSNVSNIRITAAGTTYGWNDLESADFWRAYLQERGTLAVAYRPGYANGTESYTFEQVETLMGEPLSPDDWTDGDRTEADAEVSRAVADQRFVQHASMTTALEETDRLFTHEGNERSVLAVAEDVFDSASLVVDLLRAGLIDENFTLYITQFPGQAISASAMNFIIKAVQPDVMDIEYHFGAGDLTAEADIESVLAAEPYRLLGGRSVFNIEIFDYLLNEDPSRLDEPIRRLAASANSDTAFIDAYMASGRHAANFAKLLSAVWPGIFGYIIGSEPDVRDSELLNAALMGAGPQVAYDLTSSQRTAINDALPGLALLGQTHQTERAVAIAQSMKNLGVEVADLKIVQQPLRDELTTRNLYPLTLGNLRAILDADDRLPLDQIKDLHESDVYPYALSHLRQYLDAIDGVPNSASIASPDRFAEVLDDVSEIDVDLLEEVASRASDACMLHDLDALAAPLWPAITAAHRLVLSARNVAGYVAEHTVDADLAGALSSAGAILINEEDPTPLGALALSIMNAPALSDDDALRLVGSLGLPTGSVDVSNLESRAHTLIPNLVETGLIADDADAFTVLADDERAIKVELMSVSAEFPNYMTALSLSADDLLDATSSPVPAPIKDRLLAELDTFAGSLGPRAATALASWAADNARTVTGSAIATLATKGAASASTPIVRLLGSQSSTIDIDVLKTALNALGAPYSQLTTPGWDRPKVPIQDGMIAILERLQSEGVVSKYEAKAKKQVFQVSKRHS